MLGAGLQRHLKTRCYRCPNQQRVQLPRSPSSLHAYNYNDWGPYNEKQPTDSAASRAFLEALQGLPSDYFLDFERTYPQHRRRQVILPLDLYDDEHEEAAAPASRATPPGTSQPAPSQQTSGSDTSTAGNGNGYGNGSVHGSSSTAEEQGSTFWSYLQYHQHMALPEQQLDLLKAAVLIAKHAYPDASEETCRQRIQQLAQQVRARLQPEQQSCSLAAARALGTVLFQEQGYGGNSDDFYQPQNSCLHWGLEQRTGSPALLALIYLLVAQQLGLEASPLLLPSHTFAVIHTGSTPLLVDPFNGGQVCSASVVEARLNANWGFHSPLLHLDGQLPELLERPRCTGARQLLARLLANLREAYWAPLPKSGQLRWRLYSDDLLHHQCPMLHRALAVVRYQRASEPSRPRHQRDEGLTLACMGRRAEAAALLQQYLAAEPQASDRAAVEAVIQACTSAGPGLM